MGPSDASDDMPTSSYIVAAVLGEISPKAYLPRLICCHVEPTMVLMCMHMQASPL